VEGADRTTTETLTDFPRRPWSGPEPRLSEWIGWSGPDDLRGGRAWTCLRHGKTGKARTGGQAKSVRRATGVRAERGGGEGAALSAALKT